MSDLIRVVDAEQATRNERKALGFWIYIMTDCVLFATLFATYAVLHGNVFGGPAGKDIFNLPFVLAETLILLTSSFTMGLATIMAAKGNRHQAYTWLAATFILGFSFLMMEISEFGSLIIDGNGPSRSAFLSSFFTLVGTHGLHITVGLLWILVMLWRFYKHGLKKQDLHRLSLLALFWHFLDVIWIFIFTIVYLMGSLS